MKKKLIFIFSLVALLNASCTFAMQVSKEVASDELIQAINRKNVEEIQPLLSAVVQEVITNKKNPNQIKICGEPLLYQVVLYCNPGDLQTLLGHPQINPNIQAQDGSVPLHYAGNWENKDLIKLLLDHPKIDPNFQEKENGLTPLHHAILCKSKDSVQLLLGHHKIDPNQPDKNWRQTPLHLSVEYGEVGITRILLDHPKIDLNIQDDECQTPLSCARSHGNKDIAKLLAQYLLIQAIEEGNFEKIAQAMKNGAKINYQQPSNGYTPMHVAVKSGNPEVVAYLLQFEPNLTIENNGGETAIQLAVGHDDNKILENVFLKADFTPQDSIFARLFKSIIKPFRFAWQKGILSKLGVLRNYLPTTKLIRCLCFWR